MKVSNSAERIREIMRLYNLKQADVAKKTKLNRATISYYVSGQREPAQDNIFIIANAFGVDPAWLMGYDVPMVSNADMEDKYSVRMAQIMNSVKNDSRLAVIAECYSNLSDAQKDSLYALVRSMANL